ncbi:hypothetical protein [Sodalis praecaptivus]|uniref:hypothetical protein n=1 Tax=Sodalis praecaptivus TaxID=1239307 RepID=UPI00280AD5EA|nr:hypothetical protein [Sodalis praecaptivus]
MSPFRLAEFVRENDRPNVTDRLPLSSGQPEEGYRPDILCAGNVKSELLPISAGGAPYNAV